MTSFSTAEERIERSERAIDLAETNGWPDFFIGVGFINVGRRNDQAGVMSPPPDNGKNALSVSAGINIPIWRDKYDAGVREASEMLLAERSGYANVLDEMEFSIRDRDDDHLEAGVRVAARNDAGQAHR